MAIDLANNGYSLGLVARRTELLASIADSLPTSVLTRTVDVTNGEKAEQILSALIEEMGDVDLVVLSSGVGFSNPNLDWDKEAETIEVNVTGFARMVNVVVHHFSTKRKGHLVGISSISGVRGNGAAPAYGASKSFETNYLQAIRHRFAKSKVPVYVTTVQPGFVNTAMAKGEGLFWVAPVEIASRQILEAIRKRKSNVYVTKRWRLVAWLLKVLPDSIYHKL